MNEYPNSIRNNMVNTTWPNDCIRINKVPEVKKNYEVDREGSHKIRNTILALAVAASAFGYVAGISYAQNKSYEQSMTVVATESLPDGVELKVTENPMYSYFLMPDGQMSGKYNGVNAQDLA